MNSEAPHRREAAAEPTARGASDSAALPALLRMAAAHLPGALEIGIGWPVILFAVGVSIASGLSRQCDVAASA